MVFFDIQITFSKQSPKTLEDLLTAQSIMSEGDILLMLEKEGGGESKKQDP